MNNKFDVKEIIKKKHLLKKKSNVCSILLQKLPQYFIGAILCKSDT